MWIMKTHRSTKICKSPKVRKSAENHETMKIEDLFSSVEVFRFIPYRRGIYYFRSVEEAQKDLVRRKLIAKGKEPDDELIEKVIRYLQ